MSELFNDKVGEIRLSNKVQVIDPCYEPLIWCSKLLDNVAPGKYNCFVEEINGRVAELWAIKKDIPIEIRDNVEPVECVIGVDSGQCGIFDAYYYEKQQPDNNYADFNSWYRRVCELTNNAGIIDDLGVVCSSGYGDGCYSLYVAKVDDKIVAIRVVFINKDDEEWEECEEWEE